MARTGLQARPTMYCGIQMRSRLEAEYASWLDNTPPVAEVELVEWKYEPMCFAGPSGQYLPDFLLVFRHLDDGSLQHLYIEIKPIVGFPAEFRSIADRMEIIWDSEPTATLAVVELRGQRRSWSAINSGTRLWLGSGGEVALG